MKLPLSLRLVLLTLLFAAWPLHSTAQAKPTPVVVFVNGSGNCCAHSMGLRNLPERLGDLIDDLGMAKRYTAWNSFNLVENPDTGAATSTFVRQAGEYFNTLPDGTDVYLIGHSFGGDSLLSLVTSYRRSKINFRLVAAIDPVSSAGLRTKLDEFKVPKSVEYFYNVWQENQPYPFDFKSDGSVRCDALTCNQRSNNYHRNADGSEVRENCSWIEIGCNDRRENPLNARPGWKKKRAGHQGITTDAYVLNELKGIIRNLAGHEHPSAGLVADVPPPPPVKPLAGPASFPITVKVSKTDATTVYDSVARVISGGVAPLRFELVEQPKAFAYFSFDPDSGIFIFRPTSTYGIESFKFAVTDAKGQRITSQVNISFDRADIFPGHPPLTQTPPHPLPAAINPLITISSDQSNEARRLDYTATEPAELLTVRGGSLAIEAEAFLENLEDSYAGVLDCTVDWNGAGGLPVAIKDNDDSPKNYFVQRSVPASSLQPYEVTVFRMTCMAPDMPISVKDIPVIYVPNAESLKQGFDQASYTYSSTQGGTLKLSLDNAASANGVRAYRYVLNSMECGPKEGTLLAPMNENRLTIDASFDGLMADGGPQKLVWLNVPVCGKTQPLVWKLQRSTGGGTSSGGNTNGCNLATKGYSTVDAISKDKPFSFDADMTQCGKAVKASEWSCSWVSADKTWIIPSLKSVVFTADRWSTSKYNIFSFDTVKRNGCVAPETLLQRQENSCDLVRKAYKTADSTGNVKPSSFAVDMAQCAMKVKASDWSCSWVSADETWVIPALKTVIFTANRWGANKYNVFGFDTVRRNGCVNPESFR